MKVIVIGAGAWGLPAALHLSIRGHDVTLIDRDVPGGPTSSSRGASRLWRLADPSPRRMPVMRAAVEAMDRLGELVGAALYTRNTLMWRDGGSLDATAAVMRDLRVPFHRIAARHVAQSFPHLAPDTRDALLVGDAGVVLAGVLLQRTVAALEQRGVKLKMRTTLLGVSTEGGRASVQTDKGTLVADHVVIAAGPGSRAILAGLGVDLPLRTYLEQTVRFDHGGALDAAPCLFDGPIGDRAGLYAMPDPAGGYKLGWDAPLRETDGDDPDRSVDPSRTAHIERAAAALFPEVELRTLDAAVCCWTDSPDGEFVIDRVDDRVTVACGDSGEGFKYAALIGEHLADLVEERERPERSRLWGMERFSGIGFAERHPTAMGR
ncbi:FAD-dependent oxidoreductase [Microbacterium sp. 1P10UB]|uniref:NAD(P)/FAD-dependent oxidoreductase n=1 Tax=unclassified Microbacterium TaxID=2609290 RepID=UPI0039A20113